MAKQYKKLQNKVYPKKKADDKPQEKIGKDYLLIFVIAFTAVVTLVGWEHFDSLNRWMGQVKRDTTTYLGLQRRYFGGTFPTLAR